MRMQEWESNESDREINQSHELTKRLVETAMGRVREGAIDSAFRQRVILAHLSHNRIERLFRVTDAEVESTPNGVRSIGYLQKGLFIDIANLTGDELMGDLVTLMNLPRDVRAINPRIPERLSRSHLDVNEIIAQIAGANKATNFFYDDIEKRSPYYSHTTYRLNR